MEPFSFSHYCPKKSCGLWRIQWKGGKGEFLWQLSVELDLQCIDFAQENLLQGSTTDAKLNPITLGYRSFPRSGWVTCEYWWLICSQVGGSVANGRNFVICSYWPWYIKSQLGDCQYEQNGIFLLPVFRLDCLLRKEKKGSEPVACLFIWNIEVIIGQIVLRQDLETASKSLWLRGQRKRPISLKLLENIAKLY